MGLLSWIFPSDDDRLEKARRLYGKGRYADARMEAQGLQVPGAVELVADCERALASLNLEHAVSWAVANDPERIEHHLDAAREFMRPDQEDELRRARVRIEEALQEHAAEQQAKRHADNAALFEVADGFKADHAEDEIPLPPGVSEAEAEAMRARLAILIDGYPAELQPRAVHLGADFVHAVLDLEDGAADEALPRLLALPDDEPLVLHERARAALSLGDPRAAARSWRAFADAAGGHQRMGQHHTAELLAHAQATAGDLEGALATLRAARKEQPDLGSALLAQILEALERYEEAERVLRDLLRKAGAQPALYVMIARVRAKAGHRVAAMQALEKSLDQSQCEPGRCGYQPPDLATHRMLATLYLEDGLETERALELADKAATLVQQPTWDDLYLAALARRTRDDAGWTEIADKLREATPSEDPRAALLEQHLAPA